MEKNDERNQKSSTKWKGMNRNHDAKREIDKSSKNRKHNCKIISGKQQEELETKGDKEKGLLW